MTELANDPDVVESDLSNIVRRFEHQLNRMQQSSDHLVDTGVKLKTSPPSPGKAAPETKIENPTDVIGTLQFLLERFDNQNDRLVRTAEDYQSIIG